LPFFVLALASASLSCARRLPAYRGELPPPLPRARGGDAAPEVTVPGAPSDVALDLAGVRSVGVRFEYDGLERGPNGATQPFDATYYYAAQRRFGVVLRESLRGRAIALGPANGEEDLLVTVIVRSMEVLAEDCETISHSRYRCSGIGRNRTCDWEDDDHTVCWWPISLSIDVHTSLAGVGGRVATYSRQSEARSGLSEGLGQLHEQLAGELAALLIGRGLP
ncbi:MAG: hypothetical protein J0L92_21175, partial [Deltaproteobacteria bacterium]|nr:hypothetical protein [Deltaproteobacteria bacterium]